MNGCPASGVARSSAVVPSACQPPPDAAPCAPADTATHACVCHVHRSVADAFVSVNAATVPVPDPGSFPSSFHPVHTARSPVPSAAGLPSIRASTASPGDSSCTPTPGSAVPCALSTDSVDAVTSIRSSATPFPAGSNQLRAGTCTPSA